MYGLAAALAVVVKVFPWGPEKAMTVNKESSREKQKHLLVSNDACLKQSIQARLRVGFRTALYAIPGAIMH